MKKYIGSAISRQHVFALLDGSYVVQWEDKKVQELLTGKYRPYDHDNDYGHAITDYELRQLRVSGRVEYYNQKFVWLLPLPEAGRFGDRRVMGAEDRLRAFYLSTLLPKSDLPVVQRMIEQLGAVQEYTARLREDSVVILGKNGIPFRTVQEAEKARDYFSSKAPQTVPTLTVAFIETSKHAHRHTMDSNSAKLNLDDIIASQTNSGLIAGKRVVLVVKQDEERQAFGDLFREMQLDVKLAATGVEALRLMEDFATDLLIADIQLSDMHIFQMLSKAKEIENLRELPVLVLIDQPYFGTTVAKVSYLQRPISIARLRYNVYISLNGKKSDTPAE
ncbi:MAG: response regulator [bacterium]|nr:response regulator [bacterium]